jgi:hypothetical protein
MLERPLYRTPGSRRQSARRHFRNGRRAAVVRACTAARIYLDGKAPSLAVAAEACGSNIHYIRDAVCLLQADDPALLAGAMAGWISLTRPRTRRACNTGRSPSLSTRRCRPGVRGRRSSALNSAGARVSPRFGMTRSFRRSPRTERVRLSQRNECHHGAARKCGAFLRGGDNA